MPIEIDKPSVPKLLDDVCKAHQEKNAAKIVSNCKDAVIFDLSPPLLSPLGTNANAVAWLARRLGRAGQPGLARHRHHVVTPPLPRLARTLRHPENGRPRDQAMDARNILFRP
jgi:hypothetical protein